MSKDKETITSNAVEVMTVPIPKVEPSSEAVDIVAELKSLVATRGWAVIVKIINDNIAYLEKAILEKIDPNTKAYLTDDEVETLRVKRSLNIDLRDTPQNFSKVLVDTGEIPISFDPFWKTNDEIKKAQEEMYRMAKEKA